MLPSAVAGSGSKTASTSMLAAAAAACSTVLPSRAAIEISAPASSSAAKASTWPLALARWRAVRPSRSLAVLGSTCHKKRRSGD